MRISLQLALATLLTLASSVSASCPEAVRYGTSIVTPSKSGPLKYGDVRDLSAPRLPRSVLMDLHHRL
jgi:hypothetical protein